MLNKILFGLLFTTFAFAAGTTDNTFKMGKGASDKRFIFDRGAGSTNPYFLWDESESKLRFTNDGSVLKDFGSPTDAGPSSAIGALDIDWALGNVFTKTLSANSTFTFSNLRVGAIIVRITNTVSNYTVTWPGSVLWSGGTAPTQTIGAKSDVYTFFYDGATVYGSVVQDF